MPFDPNIHHRRSVRLKGYDYHSAGAYFVTICVQDRLHLFGVRNGGNVTLTAAGQMIERVWLGLPQQWPGLEMDACIVMPDHFHGIIFLEGDGLSLSDIIKRFKSYTTTCYRYGIGQDDWPDYSVRLWQRNYYDHVIRNERELDVVRNYIEMNPLQSEDELSGRGGPLWRPKIT